MSDNKLKPILFNTDMVKAILEGRKTVTRRVVKPKYKGDYYPIWKYPDRFILADGTNRKPGDWWQIWIDKVGSPYTCTKPPYDVGDILYVRESFTKNNIDNTSKYLYKADLVELLHEKPYSNWKWKPSIFMPKEAARIFLRVTNVSVARLQDITEEQAKAEGAKDPYNYQTDEWYDWHKELSDKYEIAAFAGLWESTISPKDLDKYGWDANPWVWVIEFERTEKPNEWI